MSHCISIDIEYYNNSESDQHDLIQRIISITNNKFRYININIFNINPFVTGNTQSV